MQQYIHALAKEYLLLHKPDSHYFQSYMARSNRTDSIQTHKHITRLIELAVDELAVDELVVDEVVHVEVADDVQQVPEAMLVQVLCADVGRGDVGRDVVDGDPSLRHELSEEEAQRDVLRPRAEGAVSQRVQRRCVVALQRHFRKVLDEP